MEGRRVRFLFLIPILLLILMTHKARSQNNNPSEEKAAAAKSRLSTSRAKSLAPAASAWVESTLGKMTVDEKIGQLLFTTYYGGFTSTDSPAYRQLLHDVQDLHVGGFIVITHGSPLGVVKSQAYPTALLANQLQAKSKLPLLIGADFERGTAMRFDEGTSFPTAMAVAKHFPGHGDTSADSHIDLPVTPANRERLEHLELVPFRAAISTRVGS